MMIEARGLTRTFSVRGKDKPVEAVRGIDFTVAAGEIVGLLGISLASLSYAAGLWLKSEDALAPLLDMISVPVLLLSGILLPMTFAPGWLRTLATLNPFSHVVDGARAAFRGDLGDSSLWIGLGTAAALAVVGLAVATRTFQRESA